MDEKTGYRTAFKATALFGGVQVVTILLNIVKSKLIAVWLGTTGFGIIGLFNTAISLISSLTNLGLQSSAIREIALVDASKSDYLLAKCVKAITRWVIITGAIGGGLMIVLSPLLSKWLFESNEYVVGFIWLSLAVFLTGLYNNNYAILQGVRKLRLVAKANVFGAIAGFVITIPIYYIFRDRGIVTSLILSAIMTTIVSYYYAKKINLIKISQSYRESFYIGLETVKLGIAMSVSSIFVFFVEFLVKTFISKQGGISDVGLYQAGWILNAQYLGLVFTAMAKDYFPRLSHNADDNIILKQKVNEQAEIAVLLLGPMVLFMLIFLPQLILLFYSQDFVAIVPMTQWLLIGSLLKAGSWAISFVFLAKNDSKLFLFNELCIKCITLPSYLLGYYYFGIVGIGYAFTLNYLVYLLWVVLVAYNKYKISYTSQFWKLIFVEITLPILSVVALFIFQTNSVLQWVINISLLMSISLFSIVQLNNKIGIFSIFKHKSE